MIAFLVAISMHRFEKFEQDMVEIELPEIKIPETKLPEFDLDELKLKDFNLKLEDLGLEMPKPLTLEEIKQNYKTFISPNKTIQIKYPAHWQKIDQVFLEKIDQKIEEYKLIEGELLFFAHQKRLIELPPLLTIMSIPSEMGLEQVIEETKRIAEKQQVKIEIIKKEIKNNKAYLEIKHIKENWILISKTKIIFTEEKNYLISILTSDELQKEIALEIDFIFNSVIIK